MRDRGFSVVEAMVVMMILALIGGAIMAFYPPSVRLFHRGGAEAQAENACSRVIKKMGPVVREAMDFNVVDRDATTGEIRLEVTLPLEQLDTTTGEELAVYDLGLNGLVVGDQVAFYRSDESGDPGQIAENFWRAEKVGENWVPSEMLAEGITSFTAPTRDTTFFPKGLEVVVSSRASQGPRQAQITHREYLTCRNRPPPVP